MTTTMKQKPTRKQISLFIVILILALGAGGAAWTFFLQQGEKPRQTAENIANTAPDEHTKNTETARKNTSKRKEGSSSEQLAQKEKRPVQESSREELAKKPKPRVTRGVMSLAIDPQSKTYSWSYTGNAPYGYHLVWSTEHINPRLNTPGVSSFPFVASGRHQTGRIPDTLAVETGKTYYVTVCAFTNDTHKNTCLDYAKTVIIDLSTLPQ